MTFLNNAIVELKRAILPTEHDKWVKKWWADGGDYALRFNYALTPESFVLDLGGYQGQWASDLFSRFQCRIAVFEPVPGFAKNIKDRFVQNAKIEVFAFGLGASTRQLEIGLCADGSSTFKKSRHRETIKLVDVADWLPTRPEKQIDLLKINIEGGEFEFLQRMIDTQLISKVANIQVQFHNVAPDSAAAMQRLQQQLRKTHVPTYQYRFVWESWTRD